ncbi:hypothetical protein R70006_06202 [Paraburkholderia domus]|uniref:hypothetical protein n=1 Tax=Paraburkholderia domus TaxID=2793075 RepID=UPI001911E08D|nr:hypothetical protein [Paraburkholderia domus]MBK5052834.1 hypothetical protein [Burkholderia sp. R-70006]CAE6821139.1 hypothetical protein R70006_06202 [Paraburkholderia domus]
MGEAKKRGNRGERAAAALMGKEQAREACLSTAFVNEIWYHGTEVKFADFQFPPPPKDKGSVPHTAVFLTSDREFAEGAGPCIGEATLLSSARVLDLTQPSLLSEEIRTDVCRNHLAKHSLFVNHPERWTAGWKTGDTLRFAMLEGNGEAEIILQRNVAHLMMKGASKEVATMAIQHNLTRGLIEEICLAARRTGLDAIFGHEVDRHSGSGTAIARPWLAVLNPGALAPIVWLT